MAVCQSEPGSPSCQLSPPIKARLVQPSWLAAPPAGAGHCSFGLQHWHYAVPRLPAPPVSVRDCYTAQPAALPIAQLAALPISQLAGLT